MVFFLATLGLIRSQDSNYHSLADDSQMHIYGSNYLKMTFLAGYPSCHVKFELSMFKTRIFPCNLLISIVFENNTVIIPTVRISTSESF